MSKPVTIRLKSNGQDCWHLVRVSPTKKHLLKKLAAGATIDVKTLGEVLESGWGEPPPETIDYETIDA